MTDMLKSRPIRLLLFWQLEVYTRIVSVLNRQVLESIDDLVYT